MNNTNQSERLEILGMIERGTISPDEGMKLLEVINQSEEILNEEYLSAKAEFGLSEDETDQESTVYSEHEEFGSWRKWWVVPFTLGVGITVLGAALLYWAWSANGFGFGFFLAWIPFLTGLGILVLGWNSQTGPWIHVRIDQKPGETPERIAFSLPLPMRFTAWILRTFGEFMPKLNATGIDEVILALGDKSIQDAPLVIDVNDDDGNGEKVKIYIG